jgi:hypothetical protein
MNIFVECLVDEAFKTAGNHAVNAVSNALPDFSSLGSMFGDVNKLADLTSGSLEDKKTALKNAILKQIEEMDVTVVTNSELKALRDIAQAADGNGDLNKALSEWKNLK